MVVVTLIVEELVVTKTTEWDEGRKGHISFLIYHVHRVVTNSGDQQGI